MLDPQEIRDAVARVQQGQEQVREELLKQYLPFIIKTTSQTCRRYVRLGEDDEVSVALIAFNEALDKYDCLQQTSFLSFAETVIKRRIIDYFRKNKKVGQEIPWSSLKQNTEEETVYLLDQLTWEKACSNYSEEEIKAIRREEILDYQKRLAEFGITLSDLVEVSPKHEDARKTAFEVAGKVYQNEHYRQHLFRTKSLPLKELEREVRVSRKTLERQRKYVIAVTLVLMGNYTYLGDYIEGLKG